MVCVQSPAWEHPQTMYAAKKKKKEKKKIPTKLKTVYDSNLTM